MKYKQWVVGALLGACCSLAGAQWGWRDANNVRHFSDQPPPASVPASRIFRAPKGQLPDLRKELAAQPATTDIPAVGGKAPAGMAGRNAAYEQHRAEAQEQGRRAAQEARNRAADAAACENARANLRVLESGIRVATANAAGEPAFLDETQKAEQVRRNREALASHCK
ncbi:DUF4124 domain-containing protein [Massilia sp. METH4]|uniref:DUF4124 domain-containing protein n=1 Tax=Massilia sp. METH4 TaxID=3123041 RepID=UPI0030CE46CF